MRVSVKTIRAERKSILGSSDQRRAEQGRCKQDSESEASLGRSVLRERA